MNEDGKTVAPDGYSIPHKAPVLPGVVEAHGVQSPVLVHEALSLQVGGVPAIF